MNRDYLQEALHTFNGGNWYGWKKFDDNGNKIPNEHRMCYECIEIIKDGATMPTKAEVDAKIQEIKDAEAEAETKKASGKQKLLDLGLTEEEVKALIGI
jgi:Ran GTPase-activating protein (RanGAP) involved in mRNA processing and transport